MILFLQTVAQYETIIRVMEEERDYYKKEYEVLKAVRKSSSSARATPTKVGLRIYIVDSFCCHFYIAIFILKNGY